MTRAKANQGFEDLGTLADRSPGQVLWSGTAPKGVSAEALADLPIELPRDGTYLLFVKGDELFIAECTRGISRYRLTQAGANANVELDSIGVRLENLSSCRFGAVILLRETRAIPSDAIPVEHLGEPLNLLEKYAELRSVAQDRPLTSEEYAVRNDLLREIRTAYEKKKQTRTFPPSRSTPERSTESPSGLTRSSG